VQLEVLAHRELRRQRGALQHRAGCATGGERARRVPEHHEVAPLRLCQPECERDEGRLPCAVRSEDCGHRARLEVEV
jgi:hypothetical protein